MVVVAKEDEKVVVFGGEGGQDEGFEVDDGGDACTQSFMHQL